MEWLAILLPALAITIGLALRRSRRGIPPGARVEVAFELRLPSKWAAELTARTLSGDGISGVVCSSEEPWTCSVSQRMRYQIWEVEELCKRFDRIASGRGGACARHVVEVGSRQHVFEH